MAVCAFFVLGAMTGFSAAGRAALQRTAATFDAWQTAIATYRSYRTYKTYGGAGPERATAHPQAAIALVERRDGFYALARSGGLSGPVRPQLADDLPILSGAPMEDARGGALVDYAALLVRAEARLSQLVSEMRVSSDETAELFFANTRTELIIDLDPDRAARELGRAAEVMGKWAGRENLIASLDMTAPGEAVVRLHGDADAPPASHRGRFQKVARRENLGGASRSGGEAAQ